MQAQTGEGVTTVAGDGRGDRRHEQDERRSGGQGGAECGRPPLHDVGVDVDGTAPPRATDHGPRTTDRSPRLLEFDFVKKKLCRFITD